MTENLFITGTDTAVGKTVLSALLCAALDGIYWKPIQTGAIEGTDRGAVMTWAELPPERTLPECYCFEPPVSPHLAARSRGVTIDLGRIRPPDHNSNGPLIVEGAGGVLVPLNDSDLMLDLMRRLEMPVLVAARTALGTINHTLLTLAALRNAAVRVKGVVLMGKEDRNNLRSIEQYGDVAVIGRVPWLESVNRQALLRVFESTFDKTHFV